MIDEFGIVFSFPRRFSRPAYRDAPAAATLNLAGLLGAWPARGRFAPPEATDRGYPRRKTGTCVGAPRNRH
ncbi:hypothetical protein MKOR_20790 [Mycolicibacillus koreensis]|nr:hypothetical protein MKOR_20790 [Mycolicibacillus koreensis]